MTANATAAPPPVEARIREAALGLGFCSVGIAALTPLEARARYEAWLAGGRHGEMAWLASPEHRARRDDPALLLAGVRAVISVALAHGHERDDAMDRRLGRIARYAWGGDYHALMDERLDRLAQVVVGLLPGARALGWADTGAILERAWAERAGLGWIGKHSGLLSQTGSWVLLGEVLVDRPLAPDPPVERERCGTCRRCLDACPTGAIVAPYQVDARLCISYLTIEHPGPIPRELRHSIGDWIFGCDLCQEVCPWNRFAPPAHEARLHARELGGWTLEGFLGLDEAGFRALFAGSPIRRAGRGGFLRNVCVALGNRAEAAAVPALRRTLERDPEPLVRGHAAWALGEIARVISAEGAECSVEEIVAALARAAADPDPAVREEARAAIERASP